MTAGELPLAPLVEALGPDNLLLLFAAVLLERRVLLRARQAWLLTLAAEGLVRLLYPFCWQHVYIPVMPYSLTDYLEVSGWFTVTFTVNFAMNFMRPDPEARQQPGRPQPCQCPPLQPTGQLKHRAGACRRPRPSSWA
jgi:hypothetical protein